MVIKIKTILILGLFLIISSFASAKDIKLSTKLSSKKAELGDRVVLSIDVTSSQTQIKIDDKTQNPRVEGLEFLNRSVSTSTSMSFVNGQRSVSYTQTLNLFFTPTKIGRIRIPKIPISVDNKTYYSKPLILQVVKDLGQGRRQRSQRGGSILDLFDDDTSNAIDSFFGGIRKQVVQEPEFFVDAEISNLSPYEGEQFLVKWYVYTNGALSQFDTLKFPTLKGFWKEDVEFAQNFRWQRAEKDGKTYRRALMSSYALTPYKSGLFKIDSFDLRATVSSTNFGFGRPKVFRTKSKAYDIDVKPVPEPVPDFFSGGVGNFSLELDSYPKVAKVGEPFSLGIRIKGNVSNVKFLKDLKLDLGDSFILYEKKEDIKFFPNQASYIKKIDYLLIPKNEGRALIPDLKFVYFAPDKQDYESLYLQFPGFEVLKADPNSAPVDDFFTQAEKNENQRDVKNFDFIDELPVSARFLSPSYNLLVYPIWIGLILGLFFLVYILFSKEKRESFVDELNKETGLVKDLINNNEYKAALDKMINLISFGVGALSGKRYGVEQKLESSLDMLPVSLSSYKKDIIFLNEKLQNLRFSKAGSQDKKLVNEYYSEFLNFKEKTISYLKRE